MRVLLVLSTLIFTGCFSTENSSSQDGDFGGITGSVEFMAARQVLFDSCRGCHSYHKMTEEQLLAATTVQGKLVVEGDPENSVIYFRLSGSLGPNGAKDMPENSTISTQSVATIAEWISTL